jgi:hypothetical protein
MCAVQCVGDLRGQQADSPEQQAKAQCLGLLIEFITALGAQKLCLLCAAKTTGKGLGAHTPGCAIRRAAAFVKTSAPRIS